MSKRRFNWNLLWKLVDKYHENAKRSLRAGAYYAGLVSVRAALETMLYARFLMEPLDWNTEELDDYGITVEGDMIEVPEDLRLHELIEEAYRQGLLSKSGYEAANRIRHWGNMIHCSRVAGGTRLPSVSRRNVEARLDDLDIVFEQLQRTL